MQVISKGPDPQGGKELRCRGTGFGTTAGCGALLLVTPRDVQRSSHTDYGGGSDTYYWFVCPECNARTDVSSDTFRGCGR